MDETLDEVDGTVAEAALSAPRRLEYLGRFAPPVAGRFGAWREGRLLVMFDGSALPGRCIKCGREGDCGHVAVLRLAWLPAYMRWLAGFVFIALGFARRTRMEVVLCEGCHRRRQGQYRRAGVLLLLGVALVGVVLWRPTRVGVEAAGAAGDGAVDGVGRGSRERRGAAVFGGAADRGAAGGWYYGGGSGGSVDACARGAAATEETVPAARAWSRGCGGGGVTWAASRAGKHW